MKTKLYILLVIAILASCKKETGIVLYKMRFITSETAVAKNTESLVSTKSTPSDLYSGFGTYITSLTPTKFTAKMWTIGYCDGVLVPGTNDVQMIQYLDQNPDHLPSDNPSRIVDFSNNVIVNFNNPVVFGRLRDGILEDESIDFKYFYFMPYYFYQEIPLPAEYVGVSMNTWLQQGQATIENNILKTRHYPLMRPVFPNQPPEFETYFYFGNTESTFVVNPNREEVPTSIDNPMILAPTRSLIVRSNKYTNTIYHAPGANETLTMSGIVSFNTTNLIQVYSGADNVPYTSDDIFVYAPNFWERISSRLDME